MYIDLNNFKEQHQLDQISVTALTTPLTIDFYEKWLAENNFGTMDYLKTHFSTKKNPQLINANLKSSIIVTNSYFPLQKPTTEKYPVRMALYAQNMDYHFWLKEKLEKIIITLKEQYPHEIFLPFVDSGPILERDLAYRAGLGWFGKNTCLIHPKKGSLFFISEILTSLELNQITNTKDQSDQQKLIPDFCGTCTRCIDICPTNAIKPDRRLKADDCISYLTIESKTAPPANLRTKINDWFFGCDLCQTVCPWNQKVFGKNIFNNEKITNSITTEEIHFFKEILESSNKQLQKKFFGTALHRAAGFGLKRNALIVIGNKKIKELKNTVQNLKIDPKIDELKIWCLKELS